MLDKFDDPYFTSTSISLSGNGLVLVVGAPHSIESNSGGVVRVYECQNNANYIPPNLSKTKIYPNPFNETLHVDLNEMSDICIRNMSGKIMFNQTDYTNSKLDLNFLSAGVYILTAKTITSVKAHKIVKNE